MQVVGFNFTKIAGNKDTRSPKITVNANIKFNDMNMEKVAILKDGEVIKLNFTHLLDYEDPEAKDKDKKVAEIIFEGIMTLSVTKEESKEIKKTWKKKELPATTTLNLYNFILKKCAPKALQLQEELGLPSHVQIPRLSPVKNE